MKRATRALAGYMPHDQAIRLITEGGQPDQVQLERAEALWRQLVKNIESRPVYRPSDPLLDTPEALKKPLEAFSERPDVQAIMQPFEWSIGYVDLSQAVLSYQPIVVTDDVAIRLEAVDRNDPLGIAAVCLPPPSTVKLEVAFDPAQSALTASSVNPNLRIGGFGTFDTVTPGGQTQRIFGFQLGLGVSFVQLAEYQDRWMVRDGYHRLYGLLRLGVSQIPCVIVRAKRFDETGGGRPGLFDYETLFRERPPLMSDFMSDEFSVEVRVQAQLKVVRIKAEEFFVPIHQLGEEAGDDQQQAN
jgi:hypothetical protein